MCKEDKDFILGIVIALIFIVVALTWKPIPKAVDCGYCPYVNQYEEVSK